MEAAAADRLQGLVASFERARDASEGVVDQELVVAGSRASLRFAGAGIRDQVFPALAHLAAPPTRESAFSIHLWDSASAGGEPPPRPPAAPDEAEGALYHFHDPPLRGVYQAGLEALSVLDAQAGVAWYWVGDALALPSWERACPVRQLLFWWLASRGYLQLHAAAVGTPDRGVLIVGPPGSGKSTLALACLGSGLLYAGDDYVAVSLDPSPHVASLYNSGKLDRATLRDRLPQLQRLVTNPDGPDDEKAVLYVERDLPRQTTTGFPLAALVVSAVRPGEREPRVIPTSRAAAFAALGPSTMVQLHTAGSIELATVSRLVARVPCYTIDVGSDVTAAAGAIADLLSAL